MLSFRLPLALLAALALAAPAGAVARETNAPPGNSGIDSPQWSGRRPAAPAHYRRMLTAFYEGVKSRRRDALVVTAGTAPPETTA